MNAATPGPRVYHSAIWADDRMIVWGGAQGYGDEETGFTALANGASLTLDGEQRWTQLPQQTYTPSPRMNHSATWTGKYVVIWGGCDPQGSQSTYCADPKRDGARYDPTNNLWLPMDDDAPTARRFHSAVWTGEYVIIWGGQNADGFENTGALYHPEDNYWIPMANLAPSGRSRHVAVWTGSKMIIWGGTYLAGDQHMYPTDLGEYYLDKYDRHDDHWRQPSLQSHPNGAKDLTAEWTGNSMVVYGGSNSHGYMALGATYHTSR